MEPIQRILIAKKALCSPESQSTKLTKTNNAIAGISLIDDETVLDVVHVSYAFVLIIQRIYKAAESVALFRASNSSWLKHQNNSAICI